MLGDLILIIDTSKNNFVDDEQNKDINNEREA